ncbi:MAG TPA: hypothetical protein VHT75_10185 [Acidimicrobiales bacterium]|jgi:hypothetical protein|nr:hypothetical protein [Acidimicrobiales bacterium]
MEDTAAGRWELLREVIALTDAPGTEYAQTTGPAAELIRNAGIEVRQHTGKPPEWFTSKTLAEWLLGSYLDIVATESWFAMDPWLSVASERLAAAEASP